MHQRGADDKRGQRLRCHLESVGSLCSRLEYDRGPGWERADLDREETRVAGPVLADIEAVGAEALGVPHGRVVDLSLLAEIGVDASAVRLRP